jgi:hypothetical protein
LTKSHNKTYFKILYHTKIFKVERQFCVIEGKFNFIK